MTEEESVGFPTILSFDGFNKVADMDHEVTFEEFNSLYSWPVSRTHAFHLI